MNLLKERLKEELGISDEEYDKLVEESRKKVPPTKLDLNTLGEAVVVTFQNDNQLGELVMSLFLQVNDLAMMVMQQQIELEALKNA